MKITKTDKEIQKYALFMCLLYGQLIFDNRSKKI